MKADKTSEEERRFWPSAMMERLDAPADEATIIKALARAAHPTPHSLTHVGYYDESNDRLEMFVGGVLDSQHLSDISGKLCLFAALSAYTIGRTLRGAIADTRLASDNELKNLLDSLDSALAGRTPVEPTGGTNVTDLFKRR
jgi:hypothetical protein